VVPRGLDKPKVLDTMPADYQNCRSRESTGDVDQVNYLFKPFPGIQLFIDMRTHK
jgi:hypothetical protein